MNPIRLLIVDDVAEVRQDLRMALELAGEVEVAGEAANGREAVELTLDLRPDVVLMDVEMPVMGGHEAARRIKAHTPSCRVVVLTVHSDEATREEASEAGVDGFVVKGATLEALVRAVTER
jgi:DNA-binding NarL/FixJ family response regulator